MSGPDYPRPAPGSDNSIGRFEIGLSPIGTVPAFDIWETVLSQYANSDVLMGFVQSFAAYMDPTKNFEDFFDYIWNVDTAQGVGLDIWGRIVGITRTIQVPGSPSYFGFEEGSWQPFGQAPFFSGEPLTSNYDLADHDYRLLILIKAFANICINTIPVLNEMLLTLFPHRGNCYVSEGDPTLHWFGFTESTTASGFNQDAFYDGSSVSRMTMKYVFDFALSPVELAIVQTSNVLPKPTGVLATVVQNP